jgi:ABC-2 type transport system ATP-binding protein
MAMTTLAVRTEALTKVFRVGLRGRPMTAVHRVDLAIEPGEIFGFLGANGAGKTTIFKILTGLVAPTSGQVWIMGRALGARASTSPIGFLPETGCYHDFLTAEEFLRFTGQLCGMSRSRCAASIDELLQLVGLTAVRQVALRTFSKGMLQRIGIAQALINDPPLVILDEPMSGLDPMGRKQMRELILGLKAAGKTVLFSSHIVTDVELLCDRVTMLVKGSVVATGRVRDLLQPRTHESVELVIEGLEPEGLFHLQPLVSHLVHRGHQVMAMVQGAAQVEMALDVIRAAKARLVSLTPQQRSLEELFAPSRQESTEVNS